MDGIDVAIGKVGVIVLLFNLALLQPTSSSMLATMTGGKHSGQSRKMKQIDPKG